MRAFITALSALLISLPAFPQSDNKPEFTHDIVVVRALFDDPALVAPLAAEHHLWEVDYRKNFVVLEVDRVGFEELVAAGFDVQIDQPTTELYNRQPVRLPGQRAGIDGFPCYRTVAETHTTATDLVQQYPDLATLVDIGDSWQKANGQGGHDIEVLVLTNATTIGDKPKLFAMSAIHAREYTTAELNTRFAEMVLAGYGVDADLTWLLDEHELHLLLQANPDGRVFAQQGQSWRKNTNENYCSPTSSFRGADLNRNYPFAWGCCGGSSSSQCNTTFRGASAASEPETQAVYQYVKSIFPDQRGDALSEAAPADATGVFLDIHSYSELVLWPWGFGEVLAPNGTALQTLGRKLAFFNGYTPEQAISLYPTDGTTDDFAYGELGLAAYTFELGTSFFQACSTFESQILPDNFEAMLYAAKTARTPYLTAAGPDTLSPALSSLTVGPQDSVTLSAEIDDSRYENRNGTEPVQNVAGADYFLDTPPWADGAQAVAMLASDGSFDSPAEAVTASIAGNLLSTGRHTVYVRGYDDNGNRGAVSAVFLYAIDPATAPAITGRVTAADTGAPLVATVSAGSFATASDALSGDYTLQLVAGSYALSATPDSPDYAASEVGTVSVADGETLTRDIALYPFCDLFADDVESGAGGWTAEAPWVISAERAASPTRAWSDSPGGEYGNLVDVALTSPVIDIVGAGQAELHFASRCVTEEGYDECLVEFRVDGGPWQHAATYNGEATEWVNQALDLGAVQGATLQVRFRLLSDFSVTTDGWHIDDIRVRGAGPVCLTDDADGDGVTDGFDNCTLEANPDQRDTNGDGFGNRCDPDFNDDGIVDFADLNELKLVFFADGDLDTDLNGDGSTEFSDLNILKLYFFAPPGPAAP